MRERGYSNIKVVLLSSQVIKCLCSGLGNSCKWCGLHVSWLCFWNRLLLSERYGAFPRGKYLLLLRSLFLTGVQSGLPGPSCQQEGRSCLVKLCRGWVLLLMASPLHIINQTAHQACVSCIQVRDLAGIDESLALERKIESRKRNFSLDLENLIVSISLSTLDFREW